MKKVLVVLKDVVLLSSLRRWYANASLKNQLFFAKDGFKALEVMQANAIDLVLTDLDLPDMDGVELLAQIMTDYPHVQVAVLLESSFINLENSKKLKKFSSVFFELKPESLKEFNSFLTDIEIFENKALPAGEIVMADILKLVECQKKNCAITLENKPAKQQAILYFEEGVLHDVTSPTLLDPQAVVLDILSWSHTSFSFQPLIPFQTPRKLFVSIDDLIGDDKDHRLLLDVTSKIGVLIEKILARAEARIKIDNAPDPVVNIEAEAKIEAEKAARLAAESQAKAKAEAEKTAQLAAEAKAKAEAEEKAKAEAEKAARLAAEAQAKAEAEKMARLAAEAKAKAEAEEKAKAEAQAKAEAEKAARLAAEALAKAEAEKIAKQEEEKRSRAAFIAEFQLEQSLEPLQKINDYLASAIFDTEGNLFVLHGLNEQRCETLAKNTAALIAIAAQSTAEIGLGESNFIQLNCEKNILQAYWVTGKQFIIGILLEPDSKLASLAKMQLIKTFDAMQQKLN